MSRIFSIAALCLIGCLALTGCQNSVNRVENADKTMTPNIIADKRFVTDGWLRDRLKLSQLTVSDSGGLMRVQIAAVNVRTGVFSQMWSGITGENPYRIQYRFTWLDRNGMAVDSIASTWREISVIPGETVHIQSVAPNPNCKDFIINLKEAE